MPHFPGHEVVLRRRLRQAMQGKRPRLRRVPVQPRWPTGARVVYHKYLRGLQKLIEAAARDLLFPQLEALVREAAEERGGLRSDGVIDTLDRIIGGIRIRIAGAVEPPADIEKEVTIIGGEVVKFNRKEFDRQMVAHFGVAPTVNDRFVAPAMRAFIKDNVALVRSVTTEVLPKLEQTVSRSLRAGRRVEELRDELVKQFDLSKNRAALIARDQVGKLNGELTELRQRAIGVEEYDWDNSQDERVRDSHAVMQGKRCRWDDPTVFWDEDEEAWVPRSQIDGVEEHPGQDYQCRCNAIPAISEDIWEGLAPRQVG
jgi:SPP1 gp7 family putative phage head morphogenesis protein